MKLKKSSNKKVEEKKPVDFCAEHEDQCKTLTVLGTEYRTLYTKKYENRKKWENPNENLVYSYIPGTVLEFFVEEGQEVKKDEKVLRFEAMKMINTVTAPFDGKIKKISVEIGQRIPKGIVMFEME